MPGKRISSANAGDTALLDQVKACQDEMTRFMFSAQIDRDLLVKGKCDDLVEQILIIFDRYERLSGIMMRTHQLLENLINANQG